jgi:hypothetical protein
MTPAELRAAVRPVEPARSAPPTSGPLAEALELAERLLGAGGRPPREAALLILHDPIGRLAPLAPEGSATLFLEGGPFGPSVRIGAFIATSMRVGALAAWFRALHEYDNARLVEATARRGVPVAAVSGEDVAIYPIVYLTTAMRGAA